MKLKGVLLLLFLMSAAWLTSFKSVQENKDFIVVLDAGHGGHDPGNLGNGFLEKNIALNIVLQVGQLLEAQPGIKVIYTRKDDTFVDLYVRGEIANKADADLFVSVHCDSHTSDAHGAGTFVLGLHANKQNFEIAKKENSVIYLEDNYESRYAAYDINSPESIIGLTIMQEEFLDQSIMLAKMMQDNFSNRLQRNDRQVKQAGFIVLHQTFMPSVLVETGFLTNKAEGTYLNSKKGQSEMGGAIADAILSYRDNILPAESVAIKTTDPVASGEEEQVATLEEKEAINGTETVHEKEAAPTVSGSVSEQLPEPPQGSADGAENEGAGKAGEGSTPEDLTVENHDSATDILVSSPENKEVIAEETRLKVPEETQPAPNIEFKIQLMASSKDLPLQADNFNGLQMLTKEPYKNLFRYLYGSTTTLGEAKKLQATAHRMGYDTAYIVAYKNGERIPVPEALKYVSD